MAELVLTEREQKSLRALMASEPLAGEPMPTRAWLRDVEKLVPCDALGAAIALNNGVITDFAEVNPGYADAYAADVQHTGPFYVGVMHWSRKPLQNEECKAILNEHVDALSVGFRSGPDAVAQIFFDRRKKPFVERDLAMIELLMPVFERHLRRQVTRTLPTNLTAQERRVLMQLANGLSNNEIAAALFISPATVRKHLENSFRKLGVTSRLAAVVAFEGRQPKGDRAGRLASSA